MRDYEERDVSTNAPDASTGKTMKSLFTETDTLQRQVGIRLSVLARLLRNTFDRKAASLQATRSQWTMIAIVARYPGSTQRCIAEYLDMSEASAGRLIDKLCQEGLLERRAKEDDRRARVVYVTEAAAPVLAALGEAATENEAQLFKGFSDAELEQMCAFMDRIHANASEG